MTTSRNVAVAAVALCTITTVIPAQGAPREIAPAVPMLIRSYDATPDGTEFYSVRGFAMEPVSGALVVKYGTANEEPVRIDRKTGTIRVLGRTGSGPNEFPSPREIVAMTAGGNGDVAIWDRSRLAVVWVNAAGVHTSKWPVTTNSIILGQFFADARGRVFIGQPGGRGRAGSPPPGQVAVRVDATGFRDTLRPPLVDTDRWRWTCNYTFADGSGGGSSGITAIYSPSVIWSVDRQGRIFAAWTDSNFVAIRDGAQVRRIFLPQAADPLSAADKKLVTDNFESTERQCNEKNGKFDGPRPPIPAVRPQISMLLPEINGGIAVVRSISCTHVPAWRAPETGAPPAAAATRCPIVERFDATGSRLKPFTLMPRDELMAVRADTAWVIRRNSDGLESIRELRIPR